MPNMSYQPNMVPAAGNMLMGQPASSSALTAGVPMVGRPMSAMSQPAVATGSAANVISSANNNNNGNGGSNGYVPGMVPTPFTQMAAATAASNVSSAANGGPEYYWNQQ